MWWDEEWGRRVSAWRGHGRWKAFPWTLGYSSNGGVSRKESCDTGLKCPVNLGTRKVTCGEAHTVGGD